MSGVTGAPRVKSRADYDIFVSEYEQVLRKFPGIVSISSSGSYNSDINKEDFGDIDLIVHIDSELDKSALKKELVSFFDKLPDNVIAPFTSEKHTGRKSYNSGEIVTVQYFDDQLGYSAQIDNIIALNSTEAIFKQQFLNLAAPVQGLILGLVKVATLETNSFFLFDRLGINVDSYLIGNEEFEFNLSSVELQLRKVTYESGTFNQISKLVLWRSNNYDDVQILLSDYDLNVGFDKLLSRVQRIIKNPRSAARIQGLFGSMITVKSGEVGTVKGNEKLESLEKIRKALGE